jgi:hypothetical protein
MSCWFKTGFAAIGSPHPPRCPRLLLVDLFLRIFLDLLDLLCFLDLLLLEHLLQLKNELKNPIIY